MISMVGVSKTFVSGGKPLTALSPVNLTIDDGEFVAFIGPSGCGKTTLLNMIAGIVPASAGTITHDGARVVGPNTGAGYMTQQESILPWRSAADNIALPLVIRGMPAAQVRERVAAMLGLVGLAGFADHYPAQLSGGMRKRVALAQILAYDPGTLLLDEPFGALDAQLKLLMQAELMRIWGGTKKTIVFVTHDLTEALTLADRVVVFSNRPGRIKSVHTVGLARPRDPFRIQADPAFRALYQTLWDLLAPEITAGSQEAFA